MFTADRDRSMARRGVRLLVEAARTQWRPFAVSVTGAALYAVMAVGATIVLGRVTDEVVVPAFEPDGVGRGALVGAVVAILGVTLLKILGVVLRRYFGQMAQRRMQVHWFGRVTDRYLDVPLAWYAQHPAGELLAHADADAERATMAMQPLPFSLGVVVIIAVAMVQLTVVDPVLMLVGLALFPSLALMNHVYTRRIEQPAAAAQAHVGRVSAIAHESFEGALVIKTLGLAQREQERLGAEADALRRQRLTVGRLRGAFEPALDALPNLGTVALLWLGAWRLSTGAVTTGELVQAMALFGILAFPFRVLGFLLEETPRGVVAHERIQRVLAAPVRAAPATARPLPDGPLAVELDHVRFAYAGERVLDAVTTTIGPGQVVALVGATGAGKSTLCNLVAGLSLPTAGQIRIGGVPLDEVDPEALRRAVALVFQESFLFADSVRENLTLGDDVPDDVLDAALATAQAASFVRRLPRGLDEVVGERGVTLSGGQRQRLALARALVRQPRVLLLDDATSAVDARVEQGILQALRRTVAATTLIVAHRVSTLALANRVVMLDGGRVLAEGAHADLLAVPQYAALVRAYEEAAA